MQAMNLCITRDFPPRPPQGTQQTILKIDGSTSSVYTYGGYLLDNRFDCYDPLLRSTVAWCMARCPFDRPSMLELENTILIGVTSRRDGRDEGRVSIGELLSDPPPPRQNVQSRWSRQL